MWKFAQVLGLWLLTIPALRGQGCLLPLALGWCWRGERGHALTASLAVTHVHGSSLGSLPRPPRFPSSQPASRGKLCSLASHEPHPPGQSHEGNWDWSEPCHRGGCLLWHSCILVFFVLHPPCNGNSPGASSPELL